MIQLADRADMIGTIEALYPPDSKYSETAEIGREFMDNLIGNKVGYMNWRSLPNCDLLKLATAMLEEEGEEYSVEEPTATTETKYKQYTAGWWFEKLPDIYRSQAIKNTDQSTLHKKFVSWSAVFRGAFVWSRTPKEQGFGYWMSVLKRALKGEFD